MVLLVCGGICLEFFISKTQTFLLVNRHSRESGLVLWLVGLRGGNLNIFIALIDTIKTKYKTRTRYFTEEP